MFLTDLPDALKGWGLTVIEVDGWRFRGHGEMSSASAVVCHHTAGPATGNYPSLATVRDGRSDLPGPLAQIGLGRDGTVYLIASGVAYHAGEVREDWQSNWNAIGIEAEATGVSTWPDVQVDAYARLCAALCKHYNIPVTRVLGHKEVCDPPGRKVDPNFDMDAFRERVRNATGDDMAEYGERILEKLDKIASRQNEIAAAQLQRERNQRDRLKAQFDQIDTAVDELAAAQADDATKRQAGHIKDLVKSVRDQIATEETA